MSFMKWKIIVPFFILSILINILIAWVAIYGFNLKTILGVIVYGSVSLYVARQRAINKALAFAILIAPIVLLNLLINILDFKATIYSFPCHIFMILSAITCYSYGRKKRIIPFFILIVTLGGYFAFGQRALNNKMNYGSFNKHVFENLPRFELFDKNGNLITSESISRPTILDFWISKCRPCYKSFPLVDSIYKNTSRAAFNLFVVNIPIEGDTLEKNKQLLSPFNYNFPELFASHKSIADSFRIKAYPTTLVITNKHIVFRGDFKDAVEYAKSLSANKLARQ